MVFGGEWSLPTIIRENGFRLFFFADEGGEPPHVHVEYQGAVAKFWIQPTSLVSNFGLSGADIRKASALVQKHEKLVLEKWNEFFSKKE